VAALAQTSRAALQAALPEFKSKQALQAQTASRQVNKEEASGNAFYTGKPFEIEREGYLFKYRSYDPELNRWVTIDPSGFPDGANNQIYSSIPTMEFDFQGFYSVSFFGMVQQAGQSWNIPGGLGTISVAIYNKHSDPSAGQGGVDLALNENVSKNTGKYYYWRQYYTDTTNKGVVVEHQLDNGGIEADWYNGLRTSGKNDEQFGDRPFNAFSLLKDGVTWYRTAFVTSLIEVDSLDQKHGGTPVASITWGFTISE
jgi:RHS repeat-associated protein